MAELAVINASILIAGVVFAAALGGTLAGLLGVGGGIVIVPTLFWVFLAIDFDPSISMHVSVATSLATIVATSISSALAHNKKGAIDTRLLREWGPWLAVGALSGGLLASAFNTEVLLCVFGVVGLLVAVNFLLPRTIVIARAPPRRAISQATLGTGIGGIAAMMGIGGGTLGVPVLCALSVPIHKAIGTSAAFGLIIAWPAVLALIVGGWSVEGLPPFSLGYVNLLAAAMIIPVSAGLAPVGARLAHALDAAWIKRAFAVFLAITAARMIWLALS